MLKRITIILLLAFPFTALAAPISWDFANGILQPLQSAWSAVVKGDHFVATSTASASVFPYASTTAISASNLTSGNCVQASTGGLLTTTGAPCTSGSGTVTQINTTFPLSGGPITTTGTLTFIGLSTTSPFTNGQITYVSNGNLTSRATTTASCSGTVSCTSFDILGSSPVTISGSSSGGSSIGTTSDIAVPGVAYFTSVTPSILGSVATGTVSSANTALSVTANRYVLGGALTLTVATTSTNMFTGLPGQVLAYLNGGWTGAATTTFSSGLSYSNGNVTNTGVLSLKQTYGNALTGALTLATGTQSFNGLTFAQKITDDNSGIFTFTPNVSGTLSEGGGGTNQSTYTKGDMLYASAANTLSKLTLGTPGFVLAVANGIPTWVATSSINNGVSSLIVPQGTFTGAITLATSSNTTNGLTSSLTIVGSGSTLTFTPSVSGTHTVPGGGTGVASFTASQLLYGNGTANLSSVATSTFTPGSEFSYSGTIGALVGGASGTFTLSTNGTSLTKLATMNGNTVLVNQTGNTGNVTSLATSTFGNTLYGVGTGGQILYEQSNGTPAWTATTTFNSPLSYSNGVVSCPTCGSGSGTVTSITAGDGLLGGTISTSGTLYGQVGTSSLPTVGAIPYWTTLGSATAPAKLGNVGTTTPTLGLGLSGALTTINNTAQSLSIATSSLYTGAANALPYFSSTNTFSSIPIGTPGFVLAVANGTPTWVATSSINNGVSSLVLPQGSFTGNLTLATSTDNATGLTSSLTIVGSGSTLTFTPKLTGTLAVGNGGTGLTSVTANQIIYGNGAGTAYTTVATSSLNLGVSGGGTGATSFTSGSLLYGAGTAAVQTVATTTLGGGTTGLSFSNSPVVIGASASSLSGTLVTANGGTNQTSWTAGSIPFLSSATQFAENNAKLFWSNVKFALGIGTTTPFASLQVASSSASSANFGQFALSDTNAGANLKHWLFSSLGGNFYLGTTTDAYATSSPAALTIFNNGQINNGEEDLATTTTTTTLNWRNTRGQVRIRIGSAALTVSIINATTSEMAGSRKVVLVCNPSATTAGALTWTGVEWIGTAPVQTTTANQCDYYSFDVTAATSTTGVYKIAGAAGTGFQ